MERPRVTFWDAGGMEHVKEEVRIKIIWHPQAAPSTCTRLYGKKAGGGILLYGPPTGGAARAQLARATAGEIKASFLAVGINEILDMWIGQSERNLHEIFEQARRCRPCVLFFDEVDVRSPGQPQATCATGGRQSDAHQSPLSEMDGICRRRTKAYWCWRPRTCAVQQVDPGRSAGLLAGSTA